MFKLFKRKPSSAEINNQAEKSTIFMLQLPLNYHFYELHDEDGEVIFVGKSTQDISIRKKQQGIEIMKYQN